MKIAIPTIGGILDEYLNECEVLTIFTIDNTNQIVEKELLYTPEGCDCKNNIPLTTQPKGAKVMIAYKLPEHAEGVCEKLGFKVHLGHKGDFNDVIDKFLKTSKQ